MMNVIEKSVGYLNLIEIHLGKNSLNNKIWALQEGALLLL